jgi:hypothetical protein
VENFNERLHAAENYSLGSTGLVITGYYSSENKDGSCICISAQPPLGTEGGRALGDGRGSERSSRRHDGVGLGTRKDNDGVMPVSLVSVWGQRTGVHEGCNPLARGPGAAEAPGGPASSPAQQHDGGGFGGVDVGAPGS